MMAGNESGSWDGLFKKNSDPSAMHRWRIEKPPRQPRQPGADDLDQHEERHDGQIRMRAPDAGDSTIWKQGRVILGEYVVEGELGEGGMGTVYLLVRSQSTGHRFAVKKTRFRDEASQRNFLSELQTWLDLPEHPHLVACRFFRTVGEELAIFAEYVEGGSLEDWIAQRRLTQLEQILDVAIQFAWGLHAAHELGLVHQDVKPGNVLMGPEGVAKVSDFGLARARAAAGERDAGSGQSMLLSYGGMTPAYCSPEQAAYHALSRKTDIWSFGVSVLELFTGEVSWGHGVVAGEALESYVDRAGSSGVGALKGLPLMPVGVVQVLRRCFRQKPEDRWGTLLEVAEALKGVYRECTGREYSRPTPAFTRASDQKALRHDRWTTGGVQWPNPREVLLAALKADGRDAAEADTLLPPREGSRRAQALADLATYEEARRIYERLVAKGRKELESELAALCAPKAFIHAHLDDAPGALALYDRALAIYERLVEQEGRRELANELAQSYQNKARALQALGDLKGAVGSYDRALAIYERLVEQEGRGELANALALTYQNKGAALQALGDLAGAVGSYDRALTIYERLVDQEGRQELASDLARTYQNKAIALQALGDLAAAVEFCDRALALYERLVEQEGRRELANDLARTYRNKAAALQVLGDLAAAVEFCDRALAMYERLVGQEGRRELENDLAMTYQNKANALAVLGDLAGAVGLFDRALAIWERLVEQEGRRELRGDLAWVQASKAIGLLFLGERGAASALARQAVKMLEEQVRRTGRAELQAVLDGARSALKEVL